MLTVACRVSGAGPPPGAAPSLSRRAQARSWRRQSASRLASELKARSVVVDLPLGKRASTAATPPRRRVARLRLIAAALRRPGFLPETRLPSMNCAIA